MKRQAGTVCIVTVITLFACAYAFADAGDQPKAEKVISETKPDEKSPERLFLEGSGLGAGFRN